MALALVCMQCGTDLARVRARPDPHYGLPLVICPGCGGAVTRRRHPIWSAWRSIRRLHHSLAVLALQAVVVLCLSASLVALIEDVAEDIVSHRSLADVWRWERVDIGALCGVALVTGAWLTACLSHLRGWAWMLSCLWLWSLLATLPILGHVVTAGEQLVGIREGQTLWGPLLWDRLTSTTVLAATMTVAVAGQVPGRLVRRAYTEHRRHQWRRLRRRSRAARSHG